MKIAIRIDDITPNMDWKKFRRFKQLLDDHNVKPLIGVVPENMDVTLMRDPMREDFWELIAEWQRNGWALAMHGLHHLYMTESRGIFPLNSKSEFAGLAYEQQYKMIYEGRLIFDAHGLRTDIFMPPSHTFDRNTLTALKKNGFLKITDGFGSAPFVRDGITFYPIAVKRENALNDSSDGITTFVVHTNTMNDKDFEYYAEVFRTKEMLPYTELLTMRATERGFIGNLREYVTADLKRSVMERRERKAEKAFMREKK